jgi:hypothetical protein
MGISCVLACALPLDHFLHPLPTTSVGHWNQSRIPKQPSRHYTLNEQRKQDRITTSELLTRYEDEKTANGCSENRKHD